MKDEVGSRIGIRNRESGIGNQRIECRGGVAASVMARSETFINAPSLATDCAIHAAAPPEPQESGIGNRESGVSEPNVGAALASARGA